MTRMRYNSVPSCACLVLLLAAAAASSARTLAEEGSGSRNKPNTTSTRTTTSSSSPPSSPASSPSPSTQPASPPSDANAPYTGPPLPGQVTNPTRVPSDPKIAAELPGGRCPPYIDTQRWRTTNFNDTLNTTVAISPKRPPANVPTGSWITGRATFYAIDDRLESIRVACGEPKGQFGVLQQGSCGYTNSDLSLPFPREMYAALADTNEDYPGSCGRCYEVRCKTGPILNNGRQMLVSDYVYGRFYNITDNFGRLRPDPEQYKFKDPVHVECWDDAKSVTVRVGDSCPCTYPIRDSQSGEILENRTQPWCCGGNNHMDLSFWAFEKLAHPSYGVIPIEYRPVDCDSGKPLQPVPGFVSQIIFSDSIQPGWTWLPFNAKNTVLLAKGEGVDGGVATCASLSQSGAVKFNCRQCSRPGYQPFANATSLQFAIRSNTKSSDEFASSTPRGKLPGIKLYLMNSDAETYCGAEVSLSSNSTNGTLVPGADFASKASGDWFNVKIPLAAFRCANGSTGSLEAVDRVDFQNVNVRDADICLDDIKLE